MDGHYTPRGADWIQRISIHHSAGAEPQTAEEELAEIQKIGNFHIQGRQWPGYAYHFTVAPSGRTYYTGDLHTTRYIVGKDNPFNVGVCLLGTFLDHAPTDAAMEAARLLTGEIRYELGRVVPALRHRDTPGTEPTACPGITDVDYIAGPQAAPAASAWSREEIIARIAVESDAAGIPRRLGLGAALAESGLNQYAERNGVWPDVSYGIGQQTVKYAPVGDKSDTPENRELVKQWLFDPANAIPLMVTKLAGSFFDPSNPGSDEDERIMAALSRYNSGQWVIPASHVGNRANYERSLAEADRLLS